MHRHLGGIILRDTEGTYYAIPRAALATFRVSARHRPAVEAFLRGDDVITVRPSKPATEGIVRTSRRSSDLWLLFD